MLVRENHKVVAVNEVDNTVRKASNSRRPKDLRTTLVTRVGASGIRPFEDMRNTSLDRIQELNRQTTALARVELDGDIEFRRSLGALTPAQSHRSRAASFALIFVKCSST